MEHSQSGSEKTLDVGDIVNFLRNDWRYLLIGVAIGGGGGLVAAALFPDEWEVRAMIQVGQIWLPEMQSTPALIEPLSRALERTKLKSFEDEVLRRAGASTSVSDPAAKLFRDSIRTRSVGADLINVQLRGRTPEEARRFATAMVAVLRDFHERLAEPSIERMRQHLRYISIDLERSIKEQEKLQAQFMYASRRISIENALPLMLINSNLTVKDVELRKLQARKVLLEESLSPQRTFPTGLLGDAYVPDKRAFPHTGAFVGLGMLAGVILRFVFARRAGQ